MWLPHFLTLLFRLSRYKSSPSLTVNLLTFPNYSLLVLGAFDGICPCSNVVINLFHKISFFTWFLYCARCNFIFPNKLISLLHEFQRVFHCGKSALVLASFELSQMILSDCSCFERSQYYLLYIVALCPAGVRTFAELSPVYRCSLSSWCIFIFPFTSNVSKLISCIYIFNLPVQLVREVAFTSLLAFTFW